MCIRIKDHKYFKIRTASWIVGIFCTLYCLFKMCYYTCLLSLKEHVYDDATYTLKSVKALRFLLLALYVVFLLTTLLLLFGLKMKKHLLFIPWLLAGTIFIIVETISPIYALVQGDIFYGLVNIPDPIVATACFICVYSEFRVIHEANKADKNREAEKLPPEDSQIAA